MEISVQVDHVITDTTLNKEMKNENNTKQVTIYNYKGLFVSGDQKLITLRNFLLKLIFTTILELNHSGNRGELGFLPQKNIMPLRV